MPTITVGVNSWITLAEADAYLATKLYADDWATTAQATREQAVISAFWRIYSNSNYSIPKSSTDEPVKQAQAETAFYMLEYESEMKKRRALQAAGVKEFEVSKFSETYEKGKASLLPQEAEELLFDYQAWNPVGTISRTLD